MRFTWICVDIWQLTSTISPDLHHSDRLVVPLWISVYMQFWTYAFRYDPSCYQPSNRNQVSSLLMIILSLWCSINQRHHGAHRWLHVTRFVFIRLLWFTLWSLNTFVFQAGLLLWWCAFLGPRVYLARFYWYLNSFKVENGHSHYVSLLTVMPDLRLHHHGTR